MRALVPHATLSDVMLVPLTREKVALIDKGDADAVGAVPWVFANGYAWTSTRDADDRRTNTSLHRFLWNLWRMPDAPEIDHRNRDRLDCRRANLRAATSIQNHHNVGPRSTNSSGFKGVYWNKKLNKWFAQITVANRQRHLGVFVSKEAAAAAYSRAADELVGEFASQ